MTLTHLLTQLVAINSVNPALVDGAPGERQITRFISTWLGARGVAVTHVPATHTPTSNGPAFCVAYPHFDATLEWRLWREPMLIASDAPLAQMVMRAAQDEIGCAPDVCAAPWWTDAALIHAAGIPTVIFGPPGGGIHAADEWVDVAGLERFERILLNITRSFCG